MREAEPYALREVPPGVVDNELLRGLRAEAGIRTARRYQWNRRLGLLESFD